MEKPLEVNTCVEPAAAIVQQPDRSTAPVRLLSEKQAAEMAGVSRKTIRRLIEKGRLKAADYGTGHHRNYRIHPDDLASVETFPSAPSEPHIVMRPDHLTRRRRQSSSAAAFLPRVVA